MNQFTSPDPALQGADQVSALCDGRLDTHELDALFARCRESDEPLAQWHGYQLIGEVLRGEGSALPARAPRDFLAELNQRLDAEHQPATDALAVPVRAVRGPAANDALFRWKMVSGLASVVAVAAVGWTVLAGAPSGSQGPVVAQERAVAPAATLAEAQPAAPVSAVPTRPVVVSTSQGKLIRDPALERLLSQHRQHGGMSAFQSSTGFIRNATYDSDAR
ncbi:MAG: anti-sigma factor [Hydrogenophaga sp.]|uniref:sigma-E factor negative regulatory protein n=1 Tax=Hydrogenophaga sp. TaxID=1904254 RepID=UPI00169C1ACE|nr:sigma-E factor negative regulatory protein [Hydrogenophaga sp.]NIM42606.1 anti-sigma factor [Hydrogenophaga sp.]NIN25649.1 anti-sigma factor [Hydrogenophaga sp.]NIN30311.1 anti-sigma factor [Hydrogenophaga sp.]NIN56651.1 anti-sigma factor [Hydrogenophaga sp.]NIO53226.1 anti-sigma factor [Hydrogenophaga sp.]